MKHSSLAIALLLIAPAAFAAEEPPLAAFHNGLFYVRDKTDTFRLYVQGRVHVDAIGWLGPGLTSGDPSTTLKPTFFLRRARPEIGGEFFHDWQWQLSIDLAPSTADNQTGKTDSLNCAVSAATGAEMCTPQTNPVQAPLQKPAPTDAFINFGPSPWFNVQVGQFLLPFSMENRISDNTTPFVERSLAVRNLGAPLTRDIGVMVWGEAPNKRIYYSAGIYNGDGPNRPNADTSFDFVTRVFVRPFATKSALQVGISARYGQRDAKLVGYDAPTLTTQGGFAFWRPTYKDSTGALVHVIPQGDQSALGLDAYVPWGPIDVAGEFIYASTSTREAVDGYQLANVTPRAGALFGYSYYVQLGAWLLGTRDIIGSPSAGKPLHADLRAPSLPARHGLQAVVKFEQVALTYHGASRAGSADKNTPGGPVDVHASTIGINYWATRHLRVALDWAAYLLPQNRVLHEISSRVGVQF